MSQSLPFAYPQPPRKRRTWVFVLVTVGVLLVAFCLFASVRLYLRLTAGVNRDTAVERAASDYLTDVQQGRFADAYARLCAEDREGVTVEAFTAGAKKEPAFTGFTITDTVVMYARTPRFVTVHADLTYPDGTYGSDAFPVIEVGDDWQVCRTA